MSKQPAPEFGALPETEFGAGTQEINLDLEQLGEVYTMYEVTRRYPNGREKTAIAQVGGGRMTAEQLAELYERTNHYPGATELEITPTTAVVPLKTIKGQIERLKQTGAAPALKKTTPKAKILGAVRVVMDPKTLMPKIFRRKNGDEAEPAAAGGPAGETTEEDVSQAAEASETGGAGAGPAGGGGTFKKVLKRRT